MSESATTASLTLSFMYPRAVRRDGPLGVWFFLGVADRDMETLSMADNPVAAGDSVLHKDRDSSAVFVAREDGVPVRVTAWKGLMSLHEVFYSFPPGRGVMITDHFHNALVPLTSDQRDMSDEALLEHYVGAQVHFRRTYARGVDRLAKGDRVDIDIATGKAEVRVFSRHTSLATDDPIEVHLERVDAALDRAIEPLRSAPDLGFAFSGGVDSTLLATYLEGHGKLLTVVPGCPEFNPETEYAREAGHLLGQEPHEIVLQEGDYVQHLEEVIELIGMPVWSYGTPSIAKVYASDPPEILVGTGADGAFGSGRGIRRVASMLSGEMGRRALRSAEWMPGPLGYRAKQIGAYAKLFAEAPDSPNGYAGRTLGSSGDNSGLARMFGDEAILELNRQRLQTVYDRVELETTEQDGFLRHIELSNWQYVLADPALVASHVALANGKVYHQPYSSWSVISDHVKMPARIRYYKRFFGKWVLRELLAKRLPEYRVTKPKLFTGLPFERYFEDGPLTGIWERYEIPDVVPTELHDEVRTRPTPLSWKAMTHAAWRQTVVTNSQLQPHPAVLEATFQLR